MAPGSNRIGAIMAQPRVLVAGEAVSWLPAMWSLPMAQTLARFTSPLAHEAQVAAPRGGGYAGAIAETSSGAWLVSARPSPAAPYALKLWKPSLAPSSNASPPPMTTFLSRAGENLVDPVLIAPRERPRQHPSALHDWNYANLLALDARRRATEPLAAAPAQVRLETLDAKGGTLH